MLFCLCEVELLETFVQLIDIGHGLANDGFAVVFAEFIREVLFLGRVEKGTDL